MGGRVERNSNRVFLGEERGEGKMFRVSTFIRSGQKGENGYHCVFLFRYNEKTVAQWCTSTKSHGGRLVRSNSSH